MNYRCPKCQSAKIMPVASADSPRPQIPSSLGILVPGILVLLLFVSISLAYIMLDKKMSLLLQVATITSFIVCAVAGFNFWRQFPIFKQSMQNFLRNQKRWQCRQCHHQWENK